MEERNKNITKKEICGIFVVENDGLTIHSGQTVHQLADFNIQRVVTNIQLVDRLVHTGQSGH